MILLQRNAVIPVYRAFSTLPNTRPVSATTNTSKHMAITPILVFFAFSFTSRTTMSEPPVEVPAINTRPKPKPVTTPPYNAASRGSRVRATGR